LKFQPYADPLILNSTYTHTREKEGGKGGRGEEKEKKSNEYIDLANSV